MSFLSRLFNSQPAETKASAAHSLHMTGMPAATWGKRDYNAFAQEGYRMNVVAFSAINRLATAVASMEWQILQPDGEVVSEHPFLDLIRRPNPMQSGFVFWRDKICYSSLDGNSYIERVDDSSGRPSELWNLRPDRMSIIESPTGMPAAFVYKVGNKKYTFSQDPQTGQGPILHTRRFHPQDDWLGQSPIEANAYAIDQHNESMNWIQSLLQNAARPSGALVVDAEMGLSEEEFNRITHEIEQKHAGGKNAGRPMLLEGGLDWKAMGLSPMDMEILRTKDSAARDISLAFGVPPLLLNIPGDNTYSNYREARLGFYEDTVIPLVKHEVAEINAWLSPEFGGARLRPNLDAIEAIAEKRLRLWEMADSSDDLTINETRAMKGYDPLPGPLGNMLMSEVRETRKEENLYNEDEKSIQVQFQEMAYGASRGK